jgi:hypothetical protein
MVARRDAPAAMGDELKNSLPTVPLKEALIRDSFY